MNLTFNDYPLCGKCAHPMVPFSARVDLIEHTGWKCTKPTCGRELIPGEFKDPDDGKLHMRFEGEILKSHKEGDTTVIDEVNLTSVSVLNEGMRMHKDWRITQVKGVGKKP